MEQEVETLFIKVLLLGTVILNMRTTNATMCSHQMSVSIFNPYFYGKFSEQMAAKVKVMRHSEPQFTEAFLYYVDWLKLKSNLLFIN